MSQFLENFDFFFALDGVCFKNKNDIVKNNLISDFRLCVMFVPFE